MFFFCTPPDWILYNCLYIYVHTYIDMKRLKKKLDKKCYAYNLLGKHGLELF